MEQVQREFFAIEKPLLVGILQYLNQRPHGEVADAIKALSSLPPVKLQDVAAGALAKAKEKKPVAVANEPK